MNARSLIYVCLLCFIASATMLSDYRIVDQHCLVPGERMEYRVHYGFINAGEATMQIDSTVHSLNGRPCYKVDIFGRTTGFFDLVMHVRDTWGTYIDTAAIVSHRFYQDIEEGKYVKKEIVDFDHKKNLAFAHRIDGKTGRLKEKVKFEVPDHIQDLVSGYYYMRTFDYDTMEVGQIFVLTGFYDDTTYNVQVRFLGKEELKTKVGNFDALVMSPIMPDNQFFRGKNPVRAWLSDDRHKIPLKVKAELLIGSVEIDIKGYTPGKK